MKAGLRKSAFGRDCSFGYASKTRLEVLSRRYVSRETTELLGAFGHLLVAVKGAIAEEVLRRSLLFDSGPLEDEEVGSSRPGCFDVWTSN